MTGSFHFTTSTQDSTVMCILHNHLTLDPHLEWPDNITPSLPIPVEVLAWMHAAVEINPVIKHNLFREEW